MHIDWKDLAGEILFLALMTVAGYFLLRNRKNAPEEGEPVKDNPVPLLAIVALILLTVLMLVFLWY